MNQAAGAIATPERPSKLGRLVPEYGLSASGLSANGLSDRKIPGVGIRDARVSPDNGLNPAWTRIVQSVTNRVDRETTIITVDLSEGESAQEFSTRLRMLLLFMNRETDSVSATVSPSFKNDTYPAMLALVNGFHRSGASGAWCPDGPRAIRVGKARHLFVSVDMPVADRSPSPDTLLEVVAAHRIGASWYDQRVRPRISAPGVSLGHAPQGLTVVMFGVPGLQGNNGSIFERERARNLSGRIDGVHFSRQSDWTATAAV